MAFLEAFYKSQPTSSSGSSTQRNTRHSRNGSVSKASRNVYGLMLLSSVVLFGTVRAQMGEAFPLIQDYCSVENTADNLEPYTSPYMSLGLCKNHCISNYAFAVVQGQNCWCSNYIPKKQLGVDSRCNKGCPGFPENKCGGKGTYGYLQLPANEPSGTAGVSSGSEPTDEPSQTSPIVSVVTLAGSTQTITIAPSSRTATGYAGQVVASPKDDFFSNAGRVAGVFIVIAIAIIALVAVIIWMFIRRRRARSRYGGAETPDSLGSSNGDSRAGGEGGIGGNPKRKSRSMSTLGLVNAFGSDKNIPTIATTPATGGGQSSTMLNQQMSERVTDQRLDPHQVWMRFENDNASRVSVRSLRDDQDYSRRVLRLTNPDGN